MNFTRCKSKLIPSVLLLLLNPFANAESGKSKADYLAKEYSDVFTVKKDELVIHLKNKKELSFKTAHEQGEMNSEVTLLDYIDVSEVAILKKQGYEWINYSVISTVDGTETKTAGVPVWAPDWQQFIAPGYLPADDGEKAVYQYGRCDKGACKILSETEEKVVGVKWVGNERVDLNIEKVEFDTCAVNPAHTKNKILCSDRFKPAKSKSAK